MKTTKPSFNPWPYAIIAFFTVAIICAVTFVAFCLRNSSELVTTDYYELELRHQQRMDSEARTRQLASRLAVVLDPTSQHLTVQLPKEHASLQPTGEIHLYRPSAAGLDRKLALHVDPQGEQSLDARELSAGLWHVRVTWTVNGAEFYADQPVVLGRKGA
jgi:hypothetical protein